MTQRPHDPDDDLIVTACPTHGLKVTADPASHRHYVEVARGHLEAGPHHDDEGLECWVCCPDMEIDPERKAK